MGLTEHPLRRDLVREMHLRRFAPVQAPARLVQMIYLVDKEERQAELERLANPVGKAAKTIEQESRHALIAIDEDIRFLWERQTEATTITALVEGRDMGRLDALVEWMMEWPGAVVRATKLYVEPEEEAAKNCLPDMRFVEQDLVSCCINAGVRMWSDFRIREDGFGRMLLAGQAGGPDELGRIVQRLQELGNYRNLALLGLPPVQRLMPELNRLEDDLARQSQKLGELGEEEFDDDALLHDLSRLSAEMARIRAENSYRLGATQAYAQIAGDRLETLEIKPLPGYQSLSDFTERRLVPAMRTCETFANRLRRIAERSSDAIALLNTRIDTRIKAQNLDLLKSMESSFSLQLRLQNLVEALSVIAASYYAVGLIAFMVKGWKAFPDGDSTDIILGIATPGIVLLIFILVGVIRKRVVDETK
ncbi:DUF3422 domain-containing protein [Sphingomicrobium sediminis]|uniref:DUF3422 domain-containing protein n=1 Tax=Sphingomicrobium sediminis TaxID=2950949 RepID=A0A9X2J2P2_9SPHN|nr:DUF3422 domain-containing protein [Sphingomicrobium sediminis]MCM8556496.1 DUF3422 domain-containing protein [Sphingomicrobium sediminis]